MTSPVVSRLTVFAGLAGTVFFVCLPLETARQNRLFQSREPYYVCPVPTASGAVWLRNDSYGKGYFGASRSGKRRHKGLDFLALVGNPIYAAKSGRVVFAGEEKGYGLSIYLLHPDGLSTRYAHLSTIDVREGDWVSQRSLIARCGKTGNAKDPKILPHLHFEIRHGADALNPSRGLFEPALNILSKASHKR